MKAFAFRLAALLVVVGLVFLIATWGAGCNRRSASEQVNRGCAAHGGVRSWGGDDSYSATCEDGYAFTGDRPPTWEWPW
jgi:hypothetical protein